MKRVDAWLRWGTGQSRALWKSSRKRLLGVMICYKRATYKRGVEERTRTHRELSAEMVAGSESRSWCNTICVTHTCRC